MCCFHERFSSRSTPRNLLTSSLSMAILFIFKKGYFVFVKFSENLLTLNQRDILLSSQFISKKGHLRLCLKDKIIRSANMTGFSFPEDLKISFM